MKTLYLECTMGAAGDMLAAALLELLPDREAFLKKLNSLGLPGVQISAERAVKCGITGTHFSVKVHGEEEAPHDASHDGGISEEEAEHHHHHTHRTLPEIDALLDSLDLSEKVRSDAKAVYHLLADAESRVHGTKVGEVHFHEVGMLDAVGDIVSVCLLMDEIGAEQVLASPVHTGSGSVRCAHGILPVPAPATALLLQGIPACGGSIQGELCTPTGAALLRHFVTRFGEMPVMVTQAVGYGMGKKDFAKANCLRAFLGTAEGEREKITCLACNLDDMTGEDIAFAMQQLFAAGARDVFTQPIGMKKSRPGVLLCVICLPEEADALAAVMMRHTTTLGIRRQELSRYVLDRKTETVDTPYGEVRLKHASGMGVERTKAEYDDLAELAQKHGIPIGKLREELRL